MLTPWTSMPATSRACGMASSSSVPLIRIVAPSPGPAELAMVPPRAKRTSFGSPIAGLPQTPLPTTS
jgi:hypothetical protein